MSTLSRRLAKLEGTNGDDDLVVSIQRFGNGDGEFDRVIGERGQVVQRRPNESEEALLERAQGEIVAAIKKEVGNQPCYVLQLLRKSEEELETLPQVRPQLTKDEWLIAHGLNPVNSCARAGNAENGSTEE